MIPIQEYELLEVSKLGTESGTALTCEDCGRVIFNFAVIKGKKDGRTYTVGLTCVKKLLQTKRVQFDFETELRYLGECAQFDEAARVAKWLGKKMKEEAERGNEPYLKMDEYGEEFRVNIYSDRRFKNERRGWTKWLNRRFLPFFNDITTT